MENKESHLGIYHPNSCLGTYLCAGGCPFHEYLECSPTHKYTIKQNKTFIYFPIFNNGIIFKNRQFDVEYHKTCKCQCRKKVCHKRKVFVEKYCECRCKPEYTRDKLKCKSPFEVSVVPPSLFVCM